MRTIDTGAEVRPGALLNELTAAGVPVAIVHLDGRVVLDVGADDTSQDAATAAVVAAHNPAAIDQAEATARQQFLTDVQGLKAFQTVATPTNAQTAQAVKAVSRVLARVVAELRN